MTILMAFQTNTTTFKEFLCFIFILLFLNSCLCQKSSNSNSQNIEVIYPFFPPSPTAASPSSSPTLNPPLTPPSPPPPNTHSRSKTSKKAIATAVGVTAASTLVVAGLLFFICTKYTGHEKKEPRVNPYSAAAVGARAGAGGGGGGGARLQPVAQTEFTRFDGNIKGLIVDEDGLDVLYWRKLEGSQRKSGPFHKEVFTSNKPPTGSKRNYSRGRSSTSSHPKEDQTTKLLDQKQNSSDRNQADVIVDHGLSRISAVGSLRNKENVDNGVSRFSAVGSQRNQGSVDNGVSRISAAGSQRNQANVDNGVSKISAVGSQKNQGNVDNGVSRISAVGSQRNQANVDNGVSKMSAVGSQRLETAAQVQTSHAVADAVSAPAAAASVLKAPPPPPPPVPAKKGPAAPPPPPPPGKKGPGPPPPPPAKGGESAPKPPQAPKRSPSGNVVELSAIGEDATDDKNDQVKMKPLHWEKVNVVDRGHSMVWDKLERGSFQYNGDMMEALFGYVATNRKSPKGSNSTADDSSVPNPAAKIFVFDSRRSQNIAIVIRSLGISRQELIDGLLEGKGLNEDILEKLTRMAPTREEKTLLLAFDGDVGRLADAESFLYHLLKAVPSAFTRVNAMLFRYTYGSEIQHLKDSLETLDSACSELRNRGVFLKLLEAILKAGNRLNAGTARGDAKAFNLTALRKLSDYKSSDGKTTLLHFVVHEVVRNEGRRCVMNRNNSLNRSNSQKNSGSSMSSDEPKSKEEQEKEFLKLGLPVVGGLSSEFINVKKAATIDYDSLTGIITSLGSRISETRQLVLQCGADGGGGEFIKEMKEFLGSAEGEVKAVQEEQKKVLELVKKTTQYYQSGAFKDKHPLQMFVIVKDFLGMVDKACIDITRSLQQKKANTGGGAGSSASSSSAPTPDVLRTRVTFPRLPDHFLSDKTNVSDSDDDH